MYVLIYLFGNLILFYFPHIVEEGGLYFSFTFGTFAGTLGTVQVGKNFRNFWQEL
jgi:hypothetical protein